MRIPQSKWREYIANLRKINDKAAAAVENWMTLHPEATAEELVEVAYMIATRYGEAAAALTCQMYDSIADVQGVAVAPAEPAATATYGETAKAVYGTMKNKDNSVPATVGRLVKMAGADTMLQNAERDGAQFAWIPMGDTCAFCITLASRGWQYMSKKALKNGHAEHIHANCDCTYAIRFNDNLSVGGYDPDKYLEMYENADGFTPKDRINAMRREIYAKQKEDQS